MPTDNNKCLNKIFISDNILDTTAPKIYNCPERQLSMTVENEQENVTSLWSEIFAEDESCQPVQLTSSHKSRDYFFVGVTLVTYNFTDSSGNLAQCIFSVNISVLGTEQNRGSPPGFAFCPDSIVVNSSSETTRTQVTWVEPILRSSVTEFTLYQSHFPGDSFPVGRTNVIYEIQVMNEDSTTQAHCRFDVYVKDVFPPTVFNCPQERRIKSCRGLKVVHWYEPIAIDYSGFPVTVSQSHKPGSSKFKAGTDTVIYTFTDGSGNIATCSFNVILHRNGCGLVTSIFTLCFGLLVALLLVFVLILHFTYRRSTRQRHTDTS
ncbi:Hyalin [Holothuria leucospilota]|uniref:Hyalin n=1 Tax=Holothuria leucospilota TaxID=206669 RepID=A0A9Q1BXA2_HOLLE|nr:Hyalin [Holothuria leucospilota]